jgi:hypothetical protein
MQVSTAAETASKEVTLTWYALPIPSHVYQQTTSNLEVGLSEQAYI